jgi:multidrug efflux system membrane fusion protein
VTAIGMGVSAGETVVTDGQLRLTPGASIRSKPAPGTESPPAQQTAAK